MNCNVTMLTRNRYALTKQALSTVEEGEITILDDRSEKETRLFLRRWANAQYAVHLVCNDTPMGTGAARNRVIYESDARFGRCTFLYLSDNDVFFRENWLDNMMRCCEEAEKFGFAVVGAYNHPFHQPVTSEHLSYGYKVNEVHALATQSMMMRWEVFDTYGPFCDTPVDRVCMSEDVDFTNKIRADGYKIGVVSPALVVSTGITNTFGEKIPGWELVKAQCPDGVVCE